MGRRCTLSNCNRRKRSVRVQAECDEAGNGATEAALVDSHPVPGSRLLHPGERRDPWRSPRRIHSGARQRPDEVRPVPSVSKCRHGVRNAEGVPAYRGYPATSGGPMLPLLYIPERSRQQARRLPEASPSQATPMRFTRERDGAERMSLTPFLLSCLALSAFPAHFFSHGRKLASASLTHCVSAKSRLGLQFSRLLVPTPPFPT